MIEREGIPLEDIPEPWRYLLKYVPNLAYWKVYSDIKDSNNFCGDIQRAFCIYWALIMYKKTGIGGVDVGVGQIDAKTYHAIGVDYYRGDSHPSYGGAYWPDVEAEGTDLPFEDETFSFVVSNHSIEHMDAKKAFNEWLRILKPGGIIALVTPDGKYGPIPDPDGHVREWTPYEFFVEILSPLIEEEKIIIIEIDSFNNHFSFNLVVEKK